MQIDVESVCFIALYKDDIANICYLDSFAVFELQVVSHSTLGLFRASSNLFEHV